MQTDFAYQCPVCQHDITVSDNVIGTIVDCPSCDSPIQIEVPVAHQVVDHTPNPDAPRIDYAEREENILRELHPSMFRKHPIRYIFYAGIVLVGLLGIINTMANGDLVAAGGWLTFTSWIQWAISGAITLAGLILFLKWWLEIRYTTLIVTSKRTILRKGIVSRETSEVQHDDVRNIQVDQNMYERIVGVGDLAISSSGQDDLEIVVLGIAHPEDVADVVRDLQ